jgi:hypothetical protein
MGYMSEGKRRQVVVVGTGINLNGRTTKGDSIDSEEERGCSQ